MAQHTEENNKLKSALTQTQRELESQQLQWQKERSQLLQSLRIIHHTLKKEEKVPEIKWDGKMDSVVDPEEQIKKVEKKA